jgi:hypothetical protein
MVDPKKERLQQVNQILSIMDSLREMHTNSDMRVDGGLCYLSLPHDEPNAVYLAFNPKANRDFIVETAIRFTATPTLMGLEIYPAAMPDAQDATSPVAEWITGIKEK